MQDPDAALKVATKELRAGFAEGLAVRIGLAELDRGDSVAVENTIAKAKAILDATETMGRAENDRHLALCLPRTEGKTEAPWNSLSDVVIC